MARISLIEVRRRAVEGLAPHAEEKRHKEAKEIRYYYTVFSDQIYSNIYLYIHTVYVVYLSPIATYYYRYIHFNSRLFFLTFSIFT